LEIWKTRLVKISLPVTIALSLSWLTLFIVSPALANGPLPNGVTAGDTDQTSTILWARGTTPGEVLFAYSTDPTLNSNVFTTTATVTNVLQPVKVQITSLSPETTYFYRITDASSASGEGRFRTAAQLGTYTGLRFGVSGDWREELAPYPAIANADERDLDFFVEHGDTIVAGSATSVDDFRLKHTGVYSTHHGLNTWAELRRSTSILAMIDDNDVRDNFAGGAHPSTDARFSGYSGNFINETDLYTNALQAFQEYNPLLSKYYGATGDNRTANKRKLYRFNRYGRDAAVFVLDTRSFRDEQLTPPTNEIEAYFFLKNSLEYTTRTILGAKQLSELKADLLQAQEADQITWKFILTPSPIQNIGLFKAEDRWEGYAAERTELLKFIDDNNIKNVVFVAAGLHGTIVNNLTYQETFPGTQISTGAFEVIVGPVAIDPPAGPFGPTAVEMAYTEGLITEVQKTTYDNASRAGKDEFVKQTLINEILLDTLDLVVDYDYVGLDGSEINATLLQGGYVAAHTYGWTEFDINPNTQLLTVTTYGIDYYTQTLLSTNPNSVITRTPEIVSQFIVSPTMATVSDAAIGDYVWHDANHNGNQDGSEVGLAGITVFLDLDGNGSFDSGEPFDTSDTNGAYLITNLAVGLYTVTLQSDTIPPGYNLTTGNNPVAVTLAESETYEDADFGFHAPPSLSIAKTAIPAGGPVEPGDWITYTITVVNNGGPASNVVITDTLDLSKVTLVTSQTTTGTLSGPDPVQVSGFNLDTGQGVNLTLGVTVTITSATTITNVAILDSDQTDLESSNSVSHLVQETGAGSGTSRIYLPVVLKN
jgi:uncharacterized repeat protein (TIGR01451 family)